jgi:spore coat polysaccharide biosynthesis protein SpsF
VPLRVVAIIQARVNSTRLPRKVLLPLCGKPMLQHIIDRVWRATRVDQVLTAVPDKDFDAIFNEMRVASLYPYLRDENDLVGRYLAAAELSNADIVVRVCADNPCIQPEYIDAAVENYLEVPRIFFSNTVNRICGDRYIGPVVDGLGCEVLSLSRLKWLDQRTRGNAKWREHPHMFFEEYLQLGSYWEIDPERKPDLRLDVNDLKDYEFIKDIYEHCYPQNPNFGITEILAYLKETHHAAVER